MTVRSVLMRAVPLVGVDTVRTVSWEPVSLPSTDTSTGVLALVVASSATAVGGGGSGTTSRVAFIRLKRS